jgi:cell division protein FtsB|tara:strand:+ start:336 stop:701 length:366 start_codon:yes stop_codon:yes gene_type:complete
MKKDNDTIKVSSDSKLQLPLANLIGIIIVVSGAVFGYSNLTGRIGALETADTLFQADLLKKAEQEPKNLEMLMLIEHLATQLESVEEEIEASRYNKVNIDHLKEQVDVINKQIEKLRNGSH